MNTENPTPLAEPAATKTAPKALTIGLPACDSESERRFPVTPECAARLTERGIRVLMQQGAASSINYPDERYARSGVEIVSRAEALGCDIVVHLAPPSVADVRRMRRGAMLLTLLKPEAQEPRAVKALLEKHVITIALDLVEDSHGCTPFADILAEIDGRASIAMASSLLSDAARGKGILLGGVAGIVPCEVLIVGSGIAAAAAARSAMGLGATVRMYDNDVYSLRRTAQELGPWVISSTLHPHTLENALRAADVVVVTPTAEPFSVGRETVQTMKAGVLAFDLSTDDGSAFPSMQAVDLARAFAVRDSAALRGPLCYTHAGCAVARTAAMALSNTLLTLMDRIMGCEGVSNALRLLPGMQKATVTFFGRIVNARVARRIGMRPVDLSIFLSLS